MTQATPTSPGVPRVEDLVGYLTKEQLRLYVYSNINGVTIERSTGNVFYSRAWQPWEVDAWIEEAFSKYAQTLAMNFEGELETTVKYTVLAGKAEYPLPVDCWKITKVLWCDPQGKKVPLRYVRDPYQEVTSGTFTESSTYLFRGMNLLINPVPDAANELSIEVVYDRVPIKPKDDRAIYASAFLPWWNWLLVLHAAIAAKTKVGGDAGDLAGRLASHEQIFLNSVESRSNDPQFVRPYDVEFGYPYLPGG